MYQNMNKKFWHSLLTLVVNKYFLSIVGFSIWIIFFDQHNLVDRYKSNQHLNQLVQDTIFYQQKIRNDRAMIKLLKTNPQNLEQFAREKYLMKAPDEEIFCHSKKRAV